MIFSTTKLNSIDDVKNYDYYYLLAAVDQLNDTILKLSFMPLTTPMKYNSGQYCQILCCDNKFRPYSIVSSPNINDQIIIHMRLKDTSLKLFFTVGKVFKIKGPFGKNFYDYSCQFPTIFFAEGIGIAAFYSILNNPLFSAESSLLVWIRRKLDDNYSENEIRIWTESIQNFKSYVFEFSEINYQEILKYCFSFVEKYKSINLYLSGSSKIVDYMCNNLVLKKNKNNIKIFSDI